MREEIWRLWDILAKIFGGLGLLITLFWSIWQFNLSRQEETESFNRTRQKEIDFAYWNRKVEVYTNLLHFAGLLSVTPPPLRGKPVYEEFWGTFFGAFQAYSWKDDDVRNAAEAFGRQVVVAEDIIAKNPDKTNIEILQDAKLQKSVEILANAIGKSLAEEKKKLSFSGVAGQNLR